MLKRLMLSLAVALPTVIGAAAVTTTAEAHPAPYPHRHNDRHDFRPHRPHCVVKRERARVWGPHGPRWVWKSVRVCR